MKTIAHRRLRGCRGGFVLVSVLWILAILTVMALGFGRRSMLERRIVWYEADRRQAIELARGAVEYGLLELRNKAMLDAYHGQAGYTGLDQQWARPVDLYEKELIDRRNPADEDTCSVSIEDALSRISLNDAPVEVLEALEVFTGRTIQDIIERRRPDNPDVLPDRFHDVAEVTSLQRLPDSVWYGSAEVPGLLTALTVWGHPEGRVNLNTADGEVLRAIPGLEDDVVDAILIYRSGGDEVLGTRDDRSFPSIEAVGNRLQVSAEKLAMLPRFATTDSNMFVIRTEATRRNGAIRATCSVVARVNGASVEVLDWRENALGT